MRPHPRLTARALLATTALVAATVATGPSAHAGTSAYQCSFPSPLGTLAVPMTMAPPSPDFGTLPAQMPVPVDTATVGTTLGVPTLLELALGNLTNFATSGMTLGLGDGTLPLNDTLVGGYDSGAHTMIASAGNAPFTLPEPGSYPITMPSSFHLVGSLSSVPFDVTCVTDSAAQIGTLVVGKNLSITDAKLKAKRIHRNHAATVITSVSRQFGAPAAGKVVLKRGAKRIGTGTLSAGTVTIKTPKFKKPGRYVLRVRYGGDQISTGSADKVVVRVLRGRS